jgi:hypothetical protein
MKKLFLILFLCGFTNLKAQLFPIRSSEKCMQGTLPLTKKDTLFIEDLIGEGLHPSPVVLDCFVIKFSEWNYIISYKLTDCEKAYVIKDGYIGPIYIYKGDKVEILTDN